MDLYQVLSVVTCVASLMTLGLVGIAVLPHVKQGVAIIRDAVLWATFVLVVVFVSWFAYSRWFGDPESIDSTRQPQQAVDSTTTRPASTHGHEHGKEDGRFRLHESVR